ncbi:hypothetical protein K458DRAFT_402463 [Lentithecium fluviatile CBS 122367]|uniref:Ubiquitin-like domain-containing protein n=1 Tax=Lentithecium fluviatile CBS 122367 TaxID=1168545 RepID=A0A6G1J8U3_9PLEO|nr:hypothetical protein K458DRAFT_402463 [Lentithecium fluviatile CBS 122367]
MATPSLPDQLVYLIIRFTASLPDLSVSIRAPHTTTTLSLKQLIRPTLPYNHTAARLRLIYAGKVLADAAPLATSLRLPPPGSGRGGTGSGDGSGSKRKGKQPVRDVYEEEDTGWGKVDVEIPPSAQRYYIHCSLGDALSAADLASEATLASTTSDSLKAQYASQTSSTHLPPSSGTISNQDGARRRTSSTAAPSTTPAPQGFDRLLSSGFTPAEISTLRTHFTTNLSYTHTPDTMPSPTTIRRLEDAWLDSTATDPHPPSSSLATAGDGGGGGENGWGAGFAVEEGGLDDMLWGYLTGFFWPLGGLVWGFREEGVWARRRQVAVVMGVVLNAAFGFMRWSQ